MLTKPLLNDTEIISHFAVVGLQLIFKELQSSVSELLQSVVTFYNPSQARLINRTDFLCEHTLPPDVYKHKSFHSIT